jgi:hypothetical protein
LTLSHVRDEVGTWSSNTRAILRNMDRPRSRVAAVEPDIALDGKCGIAWLAGHAGDVLLGDPDCDIWRSSDS